MNKLWLDLYQIWNTRYYFHCMKSVQIRSFFWSVFSSIRSEYGDLRSKSLHSVWIQENKVQKKLRIYKLSTQCFEILNHHGRNAQVAVEWEDNTLVLLRGWQYREVYRLKWAGLDDSNNYVSFRTYSYLLFTLENSVKIIHLEFLLCENKKKSKKNVWRKTKIFTVIFYKKRMFF